jgi:signal transduction histidine kinase
VADTLERLRARRAADSQPDDGLARRISVAGLQVSQAADELQQAAELLATAEELTLEAEARWATADDQIAQSAEKNAELLELLEKTRAEHAEADDRARRLEQHLQATLDHAKLMEERLAELEDRVAETETSTRVTVIVDDERDALQEAVASEIRRPLTSILGLALAMKHADPASSDAKTMIRQLASNARRLDRLVGQLIDLDKIASGEFEPSRRRTDLEALVRRVVDETPDLSGRDVRVQTEHVAIEVDPALTEQMIETLLTNAGRRTAPGASVFVTISSGQDGVVIAVDDTGPEIPTGLRGAKLAALSEDGPAARRNKPRGATGLALLSRLAELQGGRAWVEERAGGGASFRIFLPSAPPEAGEEAEDARDTATASEDEEDQTTFDAVEIVAGLRELSSFEGLDDEVVY